MGKRNYRGKRQPIPREYRHRTHVHRALGDGLRGCLKRMITALIVSVVVIVGMVTAG